jgi:hypothetical protein
MTAANIKRILLTDAAVKREPFAQGKPQSGGMEPRSAPAKDLGESRPEATRPNIGLSRRSPRYRVRLANLRHYEGSSQNGRIAKSRAG